MASVAILEVVSGKLRAVARDVRPYFVCAVEGLEEKSVIASDVGRLQARAQE